MNNLDEALADLLTHRGSGAYRAMTRYLNEAVKEAARSCTSGEAPEIFRKQGKAKAYETLLGVMERTQESSD